MPKRSDVFRYDEVGIVHCQQRCVRRAFLAGKDQASGKNFEYRREWIRNRMELLASVFAMDVLTYSVMSNHLHLMLRNRPDVVKTWGDEEVARRWLQLFPGKRLEDQLGSPTQQDIVQAIADAKKLAGWRDRLSDVSWFMRALSEPIARRANREDECTGRFWEGRFKAQKIVDEAGILACAMYVDLNPVRAAMAKSPEQSRFTSAFDRIRAEKGVRTIAAARQFLKDSLSEEVLAQKLDEALQKKDREEIASFKKQLADLRSASKRSKKRSRSSLMEEPVDSWLSPLELKEHDWSGPNPHRDGLRASNKGFLPMKLCEYLTLLDWTGRKGKDGKRGAIPTELAPILERLGIDGSMWCDLVWNYSKYFGHSRAAGKPESLKREAANQGGSWIRGQRHCRGFFST